MPAVLCESAVITCVHGGTVKAAASQRALMVDEQAVLTVSDLQSATVAGCPNTNAQAGQKPCTKVTSMLAGAATVLSAGGGPVALDTAKGLTDGVPPVPVMWSVSSAGQSKLAAR